MRQFNEICAQGRLSFHEEEGLRLLREVLHPKQVCGKKALKCQNFPLVLTGGRASSATSYEENSEHAQKPLYIQTVIVVFDTTKNLYNPGLIFYRGCFMRLTLAEPKYQKESI